MKRTVRVTFEVDTNDYADIGQPPEDTPLGCIKLVGNMLNGECDMPDHGMIACEEAIKAWRLGHDIES